MLIRTNVIPNKADVKYPNVTCRNKICLVNKYTNEL